MSKKVTPKWYRHESLHTTDVILNLVNDSLIGHMYFDSGINPVFNKHIENAIEELCKAYQACNKENEVRSKIKVDM